MAKGAKRQAHELRAAVQDADTPTLTRLVLDLCDVSEENRSFVEARLGVTAEPLAPYKQRIDEALYPDVFSSKPIRIAAARKAITEYKRAAGDSGGLLELMLYYVERGTAFTADYGDIDEGFYSSIESMYDRFLSAVEKADAATKESFRKRAQAVVGRAHGIGWGFYDYLADRYADAYEP